MGQQDLNFYYAGDIKKIMSSHGLNRDYVADVKSCTDLKQLYRLASMPGVEHIAVLRKRSSPIEDSSAYIKDCLKKNEPVLMAVFYLKDKESVLN